MSSNAKKGGREGDGQGQGDIPNENYIIINRTIIFYYIIIMIYNEFNRFALRNIMFT